jgi:RND family efflux transporter MFP subunit
VQSATVDLQDAESSLAAAQDHLNTQEVSTLATRDSLTQSLQQDHDDVALYAELAAVASGSSPVILAPFTGEVASVSVVPGDIAVPGTTLLTLVDTSTIRVAAEVPLADRFNIRLGEPADIGFDAIPGLLLHGEVVALSPTASANGLESAVVVQAPNTANDEALVGSDAFVHVQASHLAAVTVPKIAVLNLNLDPTVFVVSGGRAHRVSVVPGDIGTDNVEILTGISDGDSVVVAGAQSLGDGQEVKVSGHA